MKFGILISNSRVEREIWNSYLEFRDEKGKSRAHISKRVEIEISKEGVLVTCKWFFFIQKHQNPSVPKMNENFNIKLSEIASRKRNFSSHPRKSRVERETRPSKFCENQIFRLWVDLKNFHPQKIFTPEKIVGPENIRPWKTFAPEKHLPMKSIHP